MKTCSSCGGVLGIDCFNEQECLMISYREQQSKEQQYYAMQEENNNLQMNLSYAMHKIDLLVSVLKKQGIDLSEYDMNELPF